MKELIKKHLEDWTGLKKESIEHFAKTGRASGTFFMALKSMMQEYHEKQLAIQRVVCSCCMCGKAIEQPEEQYDMYGEVVCQSCYDYNMYQALQDGGGM